MHASMALFYVHGCIAAKYTATKAQCIITDDLATTISKSRSIVECTILSPTSA